MNRWQALLLGVVIGVAAYPCAAQEIDTGYYAEVTLFGVVDVSKLPVPQAPSGGPVDCGPQGDPVATGTQPDIPIDQNVVYLQGPGWVAWVQKDVLSGAVASP